MNCSWCGKATIEGKCCTIQGEKVHGGECERQFRNSRGMEPPQPPKGNKKEGVK
jgi:hypothetical protein